MFPRRLGLLSFLNYSARVQSIEMHRYNLPSQLLTTGFPLESKNEKELIQFIVSAMESKGLDATEIVLTIT